MEIYLFIENSFCPFDGTKLGKLRQRVKSDKGDFRLNMWKCPLCEKLFIEYKPHPNLIRDLQKSGFDVRCRYLKVDSIEVRNAKREEQEQSKHTAEYAQDYYKKYKYLLTHYNIPKKDFCKCFDEKEKVYDFFTERFKPTSAELLEYQLAYADSSVSKEVRDKLMMYDAIIKDYRMVKLVKEYFHSTYVDKDGRGFLLDDEQAGAVAASGRYILTSARAGSGKTRVIVSKVVYLIEHENVDPSEILVLAFNRNVPKEIEKRIEELIHSKVSSGCSAGTHMISPVNVTRTFHSLAYRYSDEKQILQDSDGNPRSRFVRTIIEYLKETDSSFAAKVYDS